MMNNCTRWALFAGSLLTALGCSSAVPLPSEGAVTLNIRSVNVSGMSCPITAKVYQVYDKGTPDATATSSSETGATVVDGDKGSSISCSVQGTGPFTFSGSLAAVTTESEPITVTFTNGTVDANKSTGTVDVAVYTPDLLATYSNGSTPCSVTANYMQVRPGKPGSIWVNFSCPTISNPPSHLCGIDTSTIVLENCNG